MKLYWVALKDSKYNFHSSVYRTHAEAVKRLKEFGKRENELKIYSTNSIDDFTNNMDEIETNC